MSVSYGIFKSRFKKTIADAIYNEIVSKQSRYYHFLGKENTWTDFLSPFIPSQNPAVGDVPGQPTDDFRYELHVRRDILTTKLITPSDVSYVVPRYDWVSGEIYDMYDDATNEANPAYSGAIRIEEAKFYVLTSEYNVYKCIDNNYNSPSTFEPTGTGTSIFSTPDGYKWKFMYVIPVSLRNRFLSSQYIPVTTALKSQFFSNGEIISVVIDDGGSGYNNPQITVSGNGYLEENPYIIEDLTVSTNPDIGGNPGAGYTIAPALAFPAPTVTLGAEELATALSSISGGSINSLTLITTGYGYTADPLPPQILVTPPVLTDVIANSSAWTSSTVVDLGSSTINTTSGDSSGFVATITTDGPHGFQSGDIVTIAGVTPAGYNKTTAIIVTSTNEFKYLTSSADIGAITVQGTVDKVSYLSSAGKYYQVTTAGTTGSSAPVHTTGSATNGTATLNYIGALYQYVISTALNLNDYVSYQGRYYQVTTPGTTGTSGPTHEAGSASNGTAVLTYVGKQAIVKPVMTQTAADIEPILGPGGEIVGTTINDGGIGYTNANLQVTDTPLTRTTLSGTSVGTTATITTTVPHGFSTGNSITVSGVTPSGYNGVFTINVTSPTQFTYTTGASNIGSITTQGTVTKPAGSGAVLSVNLNVGNIDTLQANVELLAVPGTIEAYKVVDGGSGYGAATLTILGDGTGATATAVVQGGRLVGVNVTNPGTGYTWTDVVVSGGGTGAVVRAIMSPLGGHGSNAIDELNASSIMFYSSIARDINQGLIVTNDYRKAGLLKNIREFGTTNRFNQDVGSGCVLITGEFDVSKLEYDQLLVMANATYKNYRIVEFNSTQILVSVFNNFTISPGDVLLTPDGYPVTAQAVTERTIDQFSGDFLFLSVREPFAPSEEQIITIRTVLTI